MLMGLLVSVDASRKAAAEMNGEYRGRTAQEQKTGTDAGVRPWGAAGVADHIGFDVVLDPGPLGRISLPRLTKTAMRLLIAGRRQLLAR